MVENLQIIREQLLAEIADLHSIPQGAVNIRENGKSVVRQSTAEIDIISKENAEGLDVYVKEGTFNKSLHIPVLITENNHRETVHNDFFIGDNCDILIVAGCGIHASSSGNGNSEHNGCHKFIIGKNCRVRYVEKHIGLGNEKTSKILNPETNITLGDNSVFEMEVTQLGGVTSSKRKTFAMIGNNSVMTVKEKILTTKKQRAKTKFEACLSGENSKCEIISRSVARDSSKQEFVSILQGKTPCFGRVECDGILLDDAQIISSPVVKAQNVDAQLSHEAQIGKIASEQLIKLQTLGLTKEQAETFIISAYLK